MAVSRNRAAELGREAVEIIKCGSYKNARGQLVSVAEEVARAKAGTVAYAPHIDVPDTEKRFETQTEVVNETTLVASRRLHEAGARPVALNFASARNVGGGFLNGARAQEESLARSSGLSACLNGQEFYRYHRQTDVYYSDYALYSPDVPMFRDDEGTLLDATWPLSMVTCAAPNANAMRQHGIFDADKVASAFASRIRRVLQVGAAHNHGAIVLGAWGCGAFGNDPQTVAPLFAEALREFDGVFARVCFAVLDTSADARIFSPFAEAFAK